MTDSSTPRPRGGKPAHGEPVIDRALRLFSAFEAHDGALSLEQLSVEAGLPKATALRLARRLTEWGALERTPDGEYVIGLRLLEIAMLSPRGQGLRTIALPYLEDLHHATGQHVQLAVRDGHESVLVERLSAHDASEVHYRMGGHYRVGGRAPLHVTGVGRVLLAFGPHELRQEVLAGELRLPGDEGTLTPDQLRTILAQVRQEGVAMVSMPRPTPMTSIAAPILGPGQEALAGLSVLAPTGSFQPAGLIPAVVTVARAISRVAWRAASPANGGGAP
ncbi:IclR family transcriptional regulator [Amycolatopsis pithecellobii]|uniref:Helix-turn-helix domain-containing protein n=1 Tax=Amycolatopsis pithecellobii TaxID=664692 RepID=A0A6N7YUK1_9PSEU|nr:IclR family transcriptional regulator [Amycolatopsis pithecellobii]MTD52533.1 helix-turn-helix domain-containing protein [Amycolatopsis pithecellobii]